MSAFTVDTVRLTHAGALAMLQAAATKAASPFSPIYCPRFVRGLGKQQQLGFHCFVRAPGPRLVRGGGSSEHGGFSFRP